MEIITYANVQLLAGILQGVAYIFGGSDYRAMLVVVGAIGFIVALVAYAFQPQKLVGWYWIATVLCVSAVLVVPKTRVQLIDRLQDCSSGGCVTTVNDVPLGLAVVASVTSRIGDKLAELFETTFSGVTYSIPEGSEVLSGFPELNYRANGLMFGNKIVRETARVSFPDVNFRYNLVKYLDNCAGPDMSDGTIDPNAVRISTDIWDTLGTGGNPARFTPVAGGAVMSCAALRGQLDAGMDAEITAATNMLGRRLNSDAVGDGNALSSAAAQARVGSQVSQAYLRARLGGAGSDAATMIKQNAMINAMGDASALRAQRTNDPTAMMVGMAEAQAKVSTNTSWITGAKVAEEAMPMIRNGIEAILYACFPIIVLMTLVVTGRTAAKLLTSYASTLLWIQLWPVLYAVLNYMATAAASRHLAAAGAMPNGSTGLSLLTSASIYENSISDVAVVGYLVVSIPVIAWSLVKGMEAIGAGALAGASAFTGGAGMGASQAASGNVSLGNARMDDVNLSPSYRDAGSMTHDNGVFTTTKRFMPGSEYETSQMRISNVGAETMLTNDRSQALSNGANIAHRNGVQAQEQESRALTDSFTQALGMAKSSTNGWSTSESWLEQHGGSRAGSFDKGIAIRQELQKQFGGQLSDQQLDAITTSAVFGGGASAGVGAGGGGGASAGANLSLSGSIASTDTSSQQASVTKATAVASQLAQQHGVRMTMGTMDEFVHAGSYGSMATGSTASTKGFDDSFTRAHSAQALVSKSRAQEEAYTTAAQASESESVRARLNAGNFTYQELGLENNPEARRQWAEQMRNNPSGANQSFGGVSHQLSPGTGTPSNTWAENFSEGPGGVGVPNMDRLHAQVDPGTVQAMDGRYETAQPADRFGEPQVSEGGTGRVAQTSDNNKDLVRALQGGGEPGALPSQPKVNPERIRHVIDHAGGQVNEAIGDANDAAASAEADARQRLEEAKSRAQKK
ncbi:MAG: conjugal transfer protein TraG N-terminal domain-containing protein [Rhizobacter sp.]